MRTISLMLSQQVSLKKIKFQNTKHTLRNEENENNKSNIILIVIYCLKLISGHHITQIAQ